MNEKLDWLQALRGIAALMVLFFHLGPHWALVPELAKFTSVMAYGFAGVDVFFVLSGFVVYQTAACSIPAKGFLHYVNRRFSRIYFLYWPSFILFTAIYFYLFSKKPESIEKFLRSFLLFYPNIWDNWIPVAWSLTSELYFYLIIGLIILIFKGKHVYSIVSLIVLLLAWNIGWVIFDKTAVFSGEQPFRFALSGLIIEFMTGCLLSALYQTRQHFFSLTSKWSLFGIPMIIFGFYLGSTSVYFDRVEILRLASYGVAGFGALILALSLQSTTIKPPRILVLLGDMSFSLYLLHTVFLDVLGYFRHFHMSAYGIKILPFSLMIPLIIILVTYTWYRLVEIRTIQLVNAFSRPTLRPAP